MRGFFQMPALLQLERKIGDPQRELWKIEWICDKAAERGRQMAEFQQSLQEGACPIVADLECTLEKMDKNPKSTTYTYQYYNIRYYVSYDDILFMYRFHRDKDCIA